MKAGNNMRISRVQNMTGSNGNKVANQFILNIGADRIFQSYELLGLLGNNWQIPQPVFRRNQSRNAKEN